MSDLTDKQKHFILKNYETKTVARMSRSLRVADADIDAYLSAQARTPLSPTRRGLFQAILLALPLVLLLLFEIGLRLASYGPNLDVLIPFENDARYLVTNPSVGRRYFFVKKVQPATSYDAILKKKPADGYRVLVLGGSSAAGYPYLHNGAFSRMLRTRLQDVLPSSPVEVMNLAMPAINSFSVRDMVAELIDYDPDLLLVYAGHNEFYGALGVGSTEVLGQRRGFVNLFLKMQHSKVVYLMRDFVGRMKSKLRTSGGADNPAQQTTLMEQMVSRKEIALDSPIYETARASFRANLTDIFQIARENDIPVVASDLVSNIRDQRPFASESPPEIDRQQWDGLLAAGETLLQQLQFSAALAKFQAAAELDSASALLNFRLAQCLEGLEDFDGARKRYYRAKDLDVVRFRASEAFNDDIHQVASAWQVPVVNMKDAFEQNSPNRLIGGNLMVEHLHPNIDGYFLMADAFWRTIVEKRLLPSDADLSASRSETFYRNHLDLTPIDLELAEIKRMVLMNGWPFKQSFTRNVLSGYQAETKAQKTALAMFRREKTWEVAHFDMAEYYSKQKNLDFAAAEYRALLKGTPYNVSPFLRLGLVYMEQKKFQDALNAFRGSLAVEPSTTAYKWMGSILVNQGNAKQGIALLQKALAGKAPDPETLYNITIAHAMLGQYPEALRYCQTLRSAFPKHPGVDALWQKLKGVASN